MYWYWWIAALLALSHVLAFRWGEYLAERRAERNKQPKAANDEPDTLLAKLEIFLCKHCETEMVRDDSSPGFPVWDCPRCKSYWTWVWPPWKGGCQMKPR
jgi:hypothetical protein